MVGVGMEGTRSLEWEWVWMARGMTRPSRLEFETPSDLEVVHFHEAIFWNDIFLVDTVARIYFRHTYAICISSYHSHFPIPCLSEHSTRPPLTAAF